jgi:hypothetical protein
MGTRFEGTYGDSAGLKPLGSCEDWTNANDWEIERRRGFYDLFLAGADAAYVSWATQKTYGVVRPEFDEGRSFRIRFFGRGRRAIRPRLGGRLVRPILFFACM